MKFAKPIAILIFVVMIVLDGYEMNRIAFKRHEADFPAYLTGADHLLNGTNPYLLEVRPPYNSTDRQYIYPLMIAWLFIPLLFVPAVVASFLWYFISVAALLYAIAIVGSLIGLRREEKYLIAGIVGLFFMSIIQSDYMYGQVDCFVFFLLVLGAKWYERQPVASGGMVGAAIAAKFMPVILLPMIVLRGWKATAAALGSLLLLAVAIPYCFAGNHLFDYYAYWYHNNVAAEMTNGDPSYYSSTLACLLAWVFGLGIAPPILKVACAAALAVFPFLLWRRGKLLPAYFLALLLIPLTATRTESHHFVVLIPGFMLLVSMLVRRTFMWNSRTIRLTTQQIVLGWIALLAMMLMILWGNHATFPLHAIGMLLLFGAIYRAGNAVNLLSQPVIDAKFDGNTLADRSSGAASMSAVT